jgi:hypothetical protein
MRRARETAVVSVAPAAERMRLALIVADSMVEQPLAIPTAFVERLCPATDISPTRCLTA